MATLERGSSEAKPIGTEKDIALRDLESRKPDTLHAKRAFQVFRTTASPQRDMSFGANLFVMLRYESYVEGKYGVKPSTKTLVI